MNRILSVFLTIAMIFTLCGTAFADESTVTAIKLQIGNPVMTVDGREQSIDENGTAPIIKNGYTLLPIRAVVEAMGGTVEWESASQTVTLNHGGNIIRLTIDNITAFLNDSPVNLDVAPDIIDGKTMLPIRFIAESFGFDVDWNGTNQEITITRRGENETPLAETNAPVAANNILIAYFSRAGENYSVGYIEKGNTEIVAEMIAEQTGGTLFQIQPVTPYPEGYEDTKVIATRENESNARPAIANKVENMESYDTIFIGYPIWYGTNPMIINSFLESYDLSGKTIIPFCTAAGSGFGSSISDIKEICPNGIFLDGFTVSGSDAQNAQNSVRSSVISWLDKIGVTPN